MVDPLPPSDEDNILEFGPPAYVFCRDVPRSFAQAIQMEQQSIDVDLARQQHTAYVEALKNLGINEVLVPADEECPDCCFVEDTAIVVSGDTVVLTCPGAVARVAEVGGVSGAVFPHFQRVLAMPMERKNGGDGDDVTIDGGDVMRVGRVFYVGRSCRSNSAGILGGERVDKKESSRDSKVNPNIPNITTHLHSHSISHSVRVRACRSRRRVNNLDFLWNNCWGTVSVKVNMSYRYVFPSQASSGCGKH